jgi:hypothetical protein
MTVEVEMETKTSLKELQDRLSKLERKGSTSSLTGEDEPGSPSAQQESTVDTLQAIKKIKKKKKMKKGRKDV